MASMLSENVRSVLEKLAQFEYHRHNTASSFLKDAEKEMDNDEDKYALSVISGVLSMGYIVSDRTYRPMLELADGRRTFAMEDIDGKAEDILKEAMIIIQPAWMKAQLGDVIWLKWKDQNCAKLAAKEFLNGFYELFDETNWITCFQMIQRAYGLSASLGKNSEVFQQVRAEISKVLHKMDGNDPLFLSLRLIELDYKNANQKELSTYLKISEKIFNWNLAKNQENLYVIEAAFELYCNLLKKMKRDSDIPAAKVKMAEYYEARADVLIKEGTAGTYRAIPLLQKAYAQYDRKSDREKILQIRKRMEELQKVSMGNMASIPFKFDTTTIYKSMVALFEGLSLQEMIIQLGRVAQTYYKEDVKKAVLKKQHEFFISTSLFTQNILDHNGHTVEIIPPLDFQDPESDPEILEKHMVKYVTEIRSLGETAGLRYAFGMLQDVGEISLNDLNFLVDNNGIIPDNRKNIVKLGLHLGLTGNLYAAMHILLPQTENIIRNLVDICGDTTSFLNVDGCEEYKTLSQLFQSEKLAECYDENILFTLRTVLNERGGPNLRNLNAHGLLEPDMGNSGVALSFLSFFIKFLSFYSVEANEVLLKLIERDAKVELEES